MYYVLELLQVLLCRYLDYSGRIGGLYMEEFG